MQQMRDVITSPSLSTEDAVALLRELDRSICSGKVDFKGAAVKTTQDWENTTTPYDQQTSIRKTRKEIEITITVATYS